MSQLGAFVYSRTYSRYLPEHNRREYWWETVRRAVEYNTSIINTSREEAEKLYDNIYNMRQFLSGRTFWVGGTQVAEKYPMSNYNCAFTVIDNYKAYHDIFYLLMIGSGVGIRVLKSDASKLPKVRTDISILHKAYSPLKKENRLEFTNVNFDGDSVTISIGDSKEGWAQAIEKYFDIIVNSEYKKIKKIIFVYDSIRPKGERLYTFGGTASGSESMLKMLDKIHKVVKNAGNRDNSDRVSLKPIDLLDIANIIGENVVSGGVRRTSEIGLIDSDDEECIKAKSKLYKQINGSWEIDKEISHRQMSNNSIFYRKKPTREKLHWHIQQMRYSGEPGWINEEAGLKRRPNFCGCNPCFQGDMRILTEDGYKKFYELENKNVNLIDNNGDIVNGKVWCSGEKETVRVYLSPNKERYIECTPDHRFMLIDGTECMAKDLSGKKIKIYSNVSNNYNDKFVKYGFMQGDGSLGRINSDTHKGVEVNIGEKDSDVANIFGIEYNSNIRKYYIKDIKNELIELGFSSEALPNRNMPSSYDNWNDSDKLSFLRGMYSANGCVIKGKRVSYKTTCKSLADKIVSELYNFNIKAYITTNKAKSVKFDNGEYICKESYDVNIHDTYSLSEFNRKIGFVQEYKNKNLIELLDTKGAYVFCVVSTGEKVRVFDFSIPTTHWGVVEGCIAHNCGEILLDSNGLCNLTTVNVMAFVKDGILDIDSLLEAQRLSARAGYRMTCKELEIHSWNQVQQRDKLLGCSLTGWQDMVNATGMNMDEQKNLLSKLRDTAKNSANEIADSVGGNRPLLVTTVKPEGTLSLLPTVSSGIHYSHSEYYIRRVRISASDPLCKVCEELGYPVLPEVGQTYENAVTKVVEFPVKAPNGKVKGDVSAIEQLENYKMFMQNYVDHNCSITVHVRNNEWDDVEEWVWNNWDDIVALSFLSYDDNFYSLLPYEKIDKDEYEKRKNSMKPFNPSLISKYEHEETELDIGSAECATGACPVR